MEQALKCSTDLTEVTRDPVLLTPAFSTDQESFGWNYLRQLPALGIPVCSLTIPDHGFGDLQNAAEYVVYAVRKMSEASGRKVILFGHQHGPLDELWALMFWPDIPVRVSSLISLATPYQGTTGAQMICALSGNCPPSVWQIATDSQFLHALNDRPLPAGPAYTSITTLYDELITPQPQASHRDGATNIVLQDICPGRLVEHFSILADNLAYALVLDAMEHPGAPANPANLPSSICAGPLFMPGVESPESAVSALGGITGFLSGFVLAIGTGSVNAEPPLRDYASGS
ncbi:MAG: esterase/lipase family protein [Burkholderiales bacterium]